MLKKLFGKKEEIPTEIAVYAPLNGKLIPLEEVPDPVFSQKMMGDGIAIEPTDGKVVSPVEGEVVQVFPTKHAIGLKAKNGAEILVHIGLETVSMQGDGFETHVTEGTKVNVGDPLVTFDLALVGEKAKSIITPIIVTNVDELNSITKKDIDATVAGKDVVMDISSK